MQVSCKITHSILLYFEKNGLDVAPLLEKTELPDEFLRDASFWISADELENWLAFAVQEASARHIENLIEEVGEQTPRLRAWGGMDSVLRMVTRPEDILFQPERWLNNFFSPMPKLTEVLREDRKISFNIHIESEQYPLISSYLVAAFSQLPVFGGGSAIHVEWAGSRISFDWSAEKTDRVTSQSLFKQSDSGTDQTDQKIMSPDLARALVTNVEIQDSSLQLKNAEILRLQAKILQLEVELKNIKQGLLFKDSVKIDLADDITGKKQIINSSGMFDGPAGFETGRLANLERSVSRMDDYMTRSLQLITLLTATDKISGQVVRAMRKVDWEKIPFLFSQAITEARKQILELKKGDNKNV